MFGFGEKKETRSESIVNNLLADEYGRNNLKEEYTYDPKDFVYILRSIKDISKSEELLEIIRSESFYLEVILEKNNQTLPFIWKSDLQNKDLKSVVKKLFLDKYSMRGIFPHYNSSDTTRFWRDQLLYKNQRNPIKILIYRLKLLSLAYYTLIYLNLSIAKKKQDHINTLKSQYLIISNFLDYFKLDNLYLDRIINDSNEFTKRIDWFDREIKRKLL